MNQSTTTAAGETLRVAVDARCLNVEHVRGIGKYVSEVIRRAGRAGGVQWRLFSNRPDWPIVIPDAADVEHELFELRGDRFRSWEQLGLPWRAWKVGADVLHCPGATLPWWQPVPAVVTLHDTIPWDYNGPNSHAAWYWRGLIPHALRRCAAVITGSDSARGDILRRWPELDPKLVVIRHGIHDRYFSPQRDVAADTLASLGVQRPYLLYFGGSDVRKRSDWARRVFEQLDDPDVQLVVCGFTESERARAKEAFSLRVRPRVCFAPFVPEEQMPCLYQEAVAVLYPTLYEGFGLPAVEAQAAGTPVLLSAVGSLCELCGPGAEVLPTEDLGAWVDTCRRLIAQRRASPTPNEAAQKWARQFSWDVSAAKHEELYRSVVAASLTKGPRR